MCTSSKGTKLKVHMRELCEVNLLDLLKPEMHSSKNSKVRWGSFAAKVLLMETMKRVLLAGIQRPDVSSSWPSIFKLKVQVKAHNRL